MSHFPPKLKISKKALLNVGSVVLFIFSALVFVYSILRSREPSPPYVRLQVNGGWGFDSDIRIFPDDSYQVRGYSHHTGESDFRDGTRDGLFSEIIALADTGNAWTLTTASLNAEAQALSPGGSSGIFDANHDFLELKLKDRALLLDFYGAESLVRFYPDTQQIKTFAELVKTIRMKTKPE